MELAMIGVFITTLGGLGMFILGMKMMTEGLQMTAGKRIKAILSAVSANRLVGCCTGAFVTAMVQSSSATTVMLIGFVTAGLMTLQQAVGMILGANVGTTVTAQLIAFKLTKLAFPAIATGVVLKYFTQQKKTRYIGEVILGFGLLVLRHDRHEAWTGADQKRPTFLAFFTKFDPSFGGRPAAVRGCGCRADHHGAVFVGHHRPDHDAGQPGIADLSRCHGPGAGGKHRHDHYGRTGHHRLQQHQRPSGRQGAHHVQCPRRHPHALRFSPVS
jgi:hypothetical protein